MEDRETFEVFMNVGSKTAFCDFAVYNISQWIKNNSEGVPKEIIDVLTENSSHVTMLFNPAANLVILQSSAKDVYESRHNGKLPPQDYDDYTVSYSTNVWKIVDVYTPVQFRGIMEDYFKAHNFVRPNNNPKAAAAAAAPPNDGGDDFSSSTKKQKINN